MKLKKRVIFCVCILLIMVLCIINYWKVEKNNELNSLVDISQFHDLYNKYWLTDEEIKDGAELLINDKLFVFKSLETPQYDIQKIDWTRQVGVSPASFSLYLQSFETVQILYNAYEMGLVKDHNRIHDYASVFLESGLEFLEDEELWDDMTWSDHTVAMRAEVLVNTLLILSEEKLLSPELRKRLEEQINIHAKFLYDDNNYTENHNHGVFQDRALLYCAIVMNNNDSQKWIEKVESRLKIQFDFLYTEEMINVENSYNYAILGWDLFESIAPLLDIVDSEYGRELSVNLDKGAEFLGYALKPNGEIPQIGDTHKGYLPELKPEYANREDLLGYVTSEGKPEIMIENNSVVYPEAKYYISREYFDLEDSPSEELEFDDAVWCLFKAGYQSYSHKHGDDLSFMLYGKGYDIFIDSGYKNYNYNSSEMSQYLRSANAHNTIVVDEESYYLLSSANANKTGFVDYELDTAGVYDYLVAYNDIYEQVSIERHLYNLGEALLIYDDIKAADEHEYSQLFHASTDMKLIEKTDTEVYYKLGDSDYFVRVKQLLNNTTNIIHHGNKDGVLYGNSSYSQNEVHTNDTIQFKNTGKNVSFVTLVTIEDKDGKVIGLDEWEFDSSSMEFRGINSLDEYEFELKSSPRNRETQIVDLKIDQRQEGDLYTFTNSTVYSDENIYAYAWYVYDNSKKIIEKTPYTYEEEFSYTSKESFYIRGYIRDSEGIVRSTELILIN